MGYEMRTTFWNDFAIADRFGAAAVRDTYKRAFDEWRHDIEYLTELVMILNWRIWLHWENGREELARVYDELWRRADLWFCENLKGEELAYYYRTTD